MKITIAQQDLRAGLAAVSPAVAKSDYLPVLGNILLSASDSHLNFSATDLEVRIDCRRPAQIERSGATTVPARLFTDFVNTLDSDDVHLEVFMNGDKIAVVSEPHHATINCLPADEFPSHSLHPLNPLTIPVSILHPMLKRALVAVASDEARPILGGVSFEFDGHSLTLAAADGYRLSVCRAVLEAEPPESRQVIASGRALAILERLIKSADDDAAVEMTFDDSQALFRLPDTNLTCSLVAGRFPNYNQIFPKKYDTHAVVETAGLLHACRTASIFARSLAGIVRLTIENGRIVISTPSSDLGDSESVVVAHIEGNPIDIAFNVKFLLDALQVVGSAQIALETTSSSNPGVVTPIAGDDFTYVIMPVHLRE